MTFVRSTRPHGPINSPLNDERWTEEGTHPTVTAGATTQNVLAVEVWGWGDEMMSSPTLDEAGTLRIGTTVGAPSPALVFFVEAARAKTCRSRGFDWDLQASGQDSSLNMPDSQMSLYGHADGSSLRTSPACSLPNVEEISQLSSVRWATSGFTTSPGECWTADTSECPSDGDGSSSLADVLLDEVPKRFFLSPRAAAGIIRRAEKRGRELPPALAAALADLASAHQDDDKRTTRTS